MMPALPLPDLSAVLAWLVALGAACAAVAVARRGRLGPGWILAALLPALIGQVGTLRAIGRGGSVQQGVQQADPVSAASAAIAAAVAPEAHGYLAGGLVAVTLAVVGSVRSVRSVGSVDRAGSLGAAGILGVLGAVGISLWVGPPSGRLALMFVVAAGMAGVAGTRSGVGGVALLAVVLTWLGARHFLLFAAHHGAIADPGGALAVQPQADALAAVMVAGPGMIVAVAASAFRWSWPRPSAAGALAVAGLVAVGVVGAVNTGRLRPLHNAASGGLLPDAALLERLPRATAATPSLGDCVAWPSDGGWRTRSRWGAPGCDNLARIVVGAPGELAASSVVDWLERDATLELLAHTERRHGPPAWQAVAVRWVQEPLPVAFSVEGRLAEQLEAWLDGHLGILRPREAVPGSVWIVDTAQGDMILMTGGGITTEAPEQRREVLDWLLGTGDMPRLVLVLGERWTVQHALDLCGEARGLGYGAVPCVWVSPAR